MALSKLAIGLIAGIGSVAAVGGITAGVIVSKQNSTQTVETDNSSTIAKSEDKNKTDANRVDLKEQKLAADETSPRDEMQIKQADPTKPEEKNRMMQTQSGSGSEKANTTPTGQTEQMQPNGITDDSAFKPSSGESSAQHKQVPAEETETHSSPSGMSVPAAEGEGVSQGRPIPQSHQGHNEGEGEPQDL